MTPRCFCLSVEVASPRTNSSVMTPPCFCVSVEVASPPTTTSGFKQIKTIKKDLRLAILFFFSYYTKVKHHFVHYNLTSYIIKMISPDPFY